MGRQVMKRIKLKRKHAYGKRRHKRELEAIAQAKKRKPHQEPPKE